jgi:uncharacterized protein YfcZ (UPF0381/DUF406 family)
MNIRAMGNTCCAFIVGSVIRIKDKSEAVSVLVPSRVRVRKLFRFP